ncbi:hypothetical protein [Serratia marcescens]|uniref:hypothetical protein n=1 Tax=Serratia marcescens TaxID=615 RepID=UPI0012930F8F|nr:hypothetical protein [Serratia marcescens]
MEFSSALLCEDLPGWQQGVVVWWNRFLGYFSIKWTYWPLLTVVGKPAENLSDEWAVD